MTAYMSYKNNFLGSKIRRNSLLLSASFLIIYEAISVEGKVLCAGDDFPPVHSMRTTPSSVMNCSLVQSLIGMR